MCGIAGILYRDADRACSSEQLRAMADSIRHRGPDDEGIFLRPDRKLGLAFRRLSIIDLEGGRQPMISEDGKQALVFNGEIYNHEALRDVLEAEGVRFKTRCDTEVILHLYRRHGESCVDHLRGMFAFAIWDAAAGVLFCARDRMGQKPFYYADLAHAFVFGSEAKAILASGEAPREADPHALHAFFTYASVPGPRSGYKHIRKLPPGHTMTVRGENVLIKQYWQPRLAINETRDYAESMEELRALLTDVVRMRLMSDVPLGVFLSGGIDSSILTALMAEAGGGRVKTFSMGFEEDKYNETQYARQVADRYRTEHHEQIVRPDAVALLPKMAAHHDEPYADASSIPTFLLSEMTRRHVTVALSGEGGDELFGGYDRYYAMQLAGRAAVLPQGLRRILFGLPAALLPSPLEYKTRRARIKKLIAGLAKSPPQAYVDWFKVLQDDQKVQVYHPDFQREVFGENPDEVYLREFRAAATNDLPAAAAYVDARCYLPNDLLVKTDIATMAYSLEGRSPFMDHKLVEFAFTLPTSFKLIGRTNKRILRDTFGGLIPSDLLTRPKMGFGVPISAWLRGQLRDFVTDTLFDPRCLQRGIYQEAGLRRFVMDHLDGRADYGPQLWALLFAETWLRLRIDGEGTAA